VPAMLTRDTITRDVAPLSSRYWIALVRPE
jgi:hypothetical protein